MTYTFQTNADGTTTLISAEGTVTQTGTPITAANMNKIEDALVDHDANKISRDGSIAMTGDLVITSMSIAKTDGTLKQPFVTYKAGDSTGGAVGIGAGASTVIGGGESAVNVLNSALVSDPTAEILILASDYSAVVWTGLQDLKTTATVGKKFGFATNGDFQIGGDNTDAGASFGVISYDKAGKAFTMRHYTGSASQYDPILKVGRVAPTLTPVWTPVTFVNNWVNTSGYTTKYALSNDGCLMINGHFQGGTNTDGSDILHVPIANYTLLNPTTKIPLLRGDSTIGWCEILAVSTSYITLQVVGSTMAYTGWFGINACVPLAAIPA